MTTPGGRVSPNNPPRSASNRRRGQGSGSSRPDASLNPPATETATIETYFDMSTEVFEKFSNQFSVTQDGSMFHLVFAQLTPPVIASHREFKQLQKAGRVGAPVVARLVIPPVAMQQLIEIVMAQWNSFAEQQNQGDAEGADKIPTIVVEQEDDHDTNHDAS